MKAVSERMNELMEIILEVRYTDLEREFECCTELLDISEKTGSTYGKAFAYTYLGDYHLAKNNSEKCGVYLHLAREICKEHDFELVNMRACHLSGFFNHIICDEQKAIEFYLQALAIAEKVGDINQICSAQNNIADMFQSKGAYDEARQYVHKAYETLRGIQFSIKRISLMVIYNLSELTVILGNPNEMDEYLAVAESMVTDNEQDEMLRKLIVLTCRCMQAGYFGDEEHAREIANNILKLGLHEIADNYIFAELLMPVTKVLINVGDKEYAQKYLEMLSTMISKSELHFLQILLRLRVLYAEKFSSGQELADAYKEYYFKTEESIHYEQGVRISGMKAKIHLHEVIIQQENTRKENKMLETAANVDALTGVHNRRYFDSRMSTALSRASDTSFGIVMIDIDYFKQFNDNYGHVYGDDVIRKVSAELKRCCNKKISPCRYGGDEFSCICFNCTDKEIEEFVINVIESVKMLNISHEYSCCDIKRVSLSIGFSNAQIANIKTVDEILESADKALYKAKLNGRNGYSKAEEILQ